MAAQNASGAVAGRAYITGDVSHQGPDLGSTQYTLAGWNYPAHYVYMYRARVRLEPGTDIIYILEYM